MEQNRNCYVPGLLPPTMGTVPGTGMEYKRGFASSISLLE